MNYFKLGIRAIHQKSIQTAILQAKRDGFDVLEIHLSSPQFLPQNYTPSQLAQIKKFAQKNSIILQTHSEIGQSLIHADGLLRKAEKEKLERAVQFSHKIGARCLTLHPGKASSYLLGEGKILRNEDLYPKHYVNLFEDSIKHIVSIIQKDLFICIENTDNFTLAYQKVLEKYLKTNKIFLTWDIMKSYSEKPPFKLRGDQWKFLNKNVSYVRNIHISGPQHSGIQSYEKEYTKFLKLLYAKNTSIIVEIVSLNKALQTKKIIRNLGF